MHFSSLAPAGGRRDQEVHERPGLGRQLLHNVLLQAADHDVLAQEQVEFVCTLAAPN